MTVREHRYEVLTTWTGDLGAGSSAYDGYARAFQVAAGGKPPIEGSADPHFRGDKTRWNPEEMLVASLSACHQLWYLHLCSTAGVVVVGYQDYAVGTMVEGADGSGRFSLVTLRLQVMVTHGSDFQTAARLHAEASNFCFIARSMNFPVVHEPTIRRQS